MPDETRQTAISTYIHSIPGSLVNIGTRWFDSTFFWSYNASLSKCKYQSACRCPDLCRCHGCTCNARVMGVMSLSLPRALTYAHAMPMYLPLPSCAVHCTCYTHCAVRAGHPNSNQPSNANANATPIILACRLLVLYAEYITVNSLLSVCWSRNSE